MYYLNISEDDTVTTLSTGSLEYISFVVGGYLARCEQLGWTVEQHCMGWWTTRQLGRIVEVLVIGD